jgi:hypothetical protein
VFIVSRRQTVALHDGESKQCVRSVQYQWNTIEVIIIVLRAGIGIVRWCACSDTWNVGKKE